MHESFEIAASSGKYSVLLTDATHALMQGGALSSHQVVLADERLCTSYSFPEVNVITVAATEEAKTLERAAPIIARLRMLGANRETHLVAIGGGVVQDIATFVASIYMRGIKWSYFPTTLLGMVDSCIGGKSSINVGSYKNLVGNFYPPEKVVVDVRYLATLDKAQLISGLMEAAKICYARGRECFTEYLVDVAALKNEPHRISNIVSRSLQAKKWFIEIDEFDRNERLLLNFGHTFGHALESATGFAIPHGIAVGIGMLIAAEYAVLADLVDKDNAPLLMSLVEHVHEQLDVVADVLRPALAAPPEALIANFESDKKHSRDHYRVIVPVEHGTLHRISVEKTAVTKSMLLQAYSRTLSSLLV